MSELSHKRRQSICLVSEMTGFSSALIQCREYEARESVSNYFVSIWQDRDQSVGKKASISENLLGSNDVDD